MATGSAERNVMTVDTCMIPMLALSVTKPAQKIVASKMVKGTASLTGKSFGEPLLSSRNMRMPIHAHAVEMII